jgi:hypothetical protein
VEPAAHASRQPLPEQDIEHVAFEGHEAAQSLPEQLMLHVPLPQ